MRRATHKYIVQFLEYNIGGIIFFLSAYGIFSLLYGVFHTQWWFAKTIGDGCGWFINYLIQRYWTFPQKKVHFHESKNRIRYATLIVVDTILGYVIVGVLKHFGLTPFLGVWASSIFFTFWNFIWYRYWVFATGPSSRPAAHCKKHRSSRANSRRNARRAPRVRRTKRVQYS